MAALGVGQGGFELPTSRPNVPSPAGPAGFRGVYQPMGPPIAVAPKEVDTRVCGLDSASLPPKRAPVPVPISRSGAGEDLEDAPLQPPENPGVIGNCLLCLPQSTLPILGLRPNIDDKGASERTMWFGRVWQVRALALQRYKRNVLQKQPGLTYQQKMEIDIVLKDPKKRELLLKMQKVWRGAAARRAGSLSTVLGVLDLEMGAYNGAVLFMHGSGGMTYNNVRYARKLAALGYIVIAPDSMAGGEFRHRDTAGVITATTPVPYWDDLGIYTSASEGVYTYNTKAEDVVKNPDKFRKLYENVFRMRSSEMHWILGRLPMQMRVRGVFTMGQSEGAMTVARFDDRRYGAMIRGRIISAFSIEYCYFTPTREAGQFGGNPEVATLNIIGDADQYFGPNDSVAKSVQGLKGGWGSEDLTGNGFKQMKRQGIRRGLAVVLEGAKHDASETHDNFLRDLLRSFLASPHECHRIPDQWVFDRYLTSKVEVLEADSVGGGGRTLVKVGKMDIDSKTPYAKEIQKRQLITIRKEAEERRLKLQEQIQIHKRASTPPPAGGPQLNFGNSSSRLSGSGGYGAGSGGGRLSLAGTTAGDGGGGGGARLAPPPKSVLVTSNTSFASSKSEDWNANTGKSDVHGDGGRASFSNPGFGTGQDNSGRSNFTSAYGSGNGGYTSSYSGGNTAYSKPTAQTDQVKKFLAFGSNGGISSSNNNNSNGYSYSSSNNNNNNNGSTFNYSSFGNSATTGGGGYGASSGGFVSAALGAGPPGGRSFSPSPPSAANGTGRSYSPSPAATTMSNFGNNNSSSSNASPPKGYGGFGNFGGGGATAGFGGFGASGGDKSSSNGEFNVSLIKSSGTYGVRVEQDSWNKSLRVDWVDPSGPLGIWNLRNGTKALKVGDMIVSVNRIRGDPDAMLKEMGAKTSVDLVGRKGNK